MNVTRTSLSAEKARPQDQVSGDQRHDDHDHNGANDSLPPQRSERRLVEVTNIVLIGNSDMWVARHAQLLNPGSVLSARIVR